VTLDVPETEGCSARLQVAFDCVGGAMTGLLLTALPYGGTVYVYGACALSLRTLGYL
jgi:hypothetical protein